MIIIALFTRSNPGRGHIFPRSGLGINRNRGLGRGYQSWKKPGDPAGAANPGRSLIVQLYVYNY